VLEETALVQHRQVQYAVADSHADVPLAVVRALEDAVR
jgi:hypothetical protein